MLGLDLGARFLRGAICDLHGDVRARQDVELPGADADACSTAIGRAARRAARARPACRRELIDGVVVGVPGVVGRGRDACGSPTNVPGLEGRAFGAELEARLGLPVTLENDINLAALGEQWRGVARGVDDFVFLSVGTGLGAGLVLARRAAPRAATAPPGEIDFARGRARRGRSTRARAAVVRRWRPQLAGAAPARALAPPYDARAIFAAARGGDAVAQRGRRRGGAADRAAHRPVAAVADVALVVLGGGIGANGDLLLDPVRALLADWLPYPPRVEVSSLGEAAVLTGALAVGLRAALDNVFANRARRP